MPTVKRDRVSPPYQGSERDLLVSFLDVQRDAMLRTVDGVDDELARRRLVDSETTLAGLLKHLPDVERSWFRRVFAGEDVPYLYYAGDDDPDSDFRVDEGDRVVDLVAVYEEEIAACKRVVAGADLEDLAVLEREREGWPPNLRWILLHMIEETARHAGHADILREQLDGVTGY